VVGGVTALAVHFVILSKPFVILSEAKDLNLAIGEDPPLPSVTKSGRIKYPPIPQWSPWTFRRTKSAPSHPDHDVRPRTLCSDCHVLCVRSMHHMTVS
jgi:hypothetical protein